MVFDSSKDFCSSVCVFIASIHNSVFACILARACSVSTLTFFCSFKTGFVSCVSFATAVQATAAESAAATVNAFHHLTIIWFFNSKKQLFNLFYYNNNLVFCQKNKNIY